MESTSEVIQRLIDASPRSKYEPLVCLKEMAESRETKFAIVNIKGLFNELKKLMRDNNELRVVAINLVSTFALNSNDKEVIAQLGTLYPILIPALNESNVFLYGAIRNYLFNSITKNISIDSFLLHIKTYGISSENKILKQRTTELFVYLVKNCPQLLDESRYGMQIVDILGLLIKDLDELGDSVTQLTQTHPSIYRLSRQLPFDLKKRYDDFLLERNIIINTNLSNDYEELDAEITATIPNINSIQKLQYSYGIVPNRIINELLLTSNWKNRVGAIEELEEILMNSKAHSALEPYVPSFIQYLISLLNDNNYKIVITCLKIINRLLKSYTLTSHSVQPLVPELIEKLGDNKVNIRQLAMVGLRLLGGILDPLSLLNKALNYLNSPKWHTREEILNFIIISFIDNSEQPTFINSVSYPDLISYIAPLLNDEKPKVAQIAYEVYATIAKLGNNKEVMQAFKDYFQDSEIYAKIEYRIKGESIPVLNEDGALEFPYISNRLLAQNTFYTGSFKVED